MAVYLSPIGNDQVFDSNGVPLVGGFWETFLAGTTTPRTTYTSSSGLIAQPAQITLDASGRPANPIWITGGVPLKFRLSDATSQVLLTLDNISGINDPSAIAVSDQWTAYTGTPTYISATSFSLPGDQTATFHVGRRVRTTNTGGIRYSSIAASVFTSVTTVTVVNDSGVLDAGLSDVAYGILSAINPSTPNLYAAKGPNTDITSLNGNPNSLKVAGPSGVTAFTGTFQMGLRAIGAESTNDYSGVDFGVRLGANPQARIAAYFTGGGSILKIGTSNNYANGITNEAITISPAGVLTLSSALPVASGGTGVTTSAAWSADLVGSRALTSTYTNNSGRVRFVSVMATLSGAGSDNLVYNDTGGNIVQGSTGAATAGFKVSITFPVPVGGSYVVSLANGFGTLTAWREM